MARATMWDNDSDHFYREISMLSDYNRSLPNANASIHSAGCNVRIVLYHYALDWYKWGGSSWEYWFDVITAGAGWHEVPVNAGGAIFN